MRGTLKRFVVVGGIILFAASGFAGDETSNGRPERLRKRDGSCVAPASQVSRNNWTCPWQAPRGDAASPATTATRTGPNDAAATAPTPADAVIAGPTTRPGMGPGRGMGAGRGMGPGARAGRGMGAGGGMRMGAGAPEVMRLIHNLLDNHLKIQRNVQEISGGVLTTTTSNDATVAAMIQSHAHQMKDRMQQGQPLRMWDPLFAELFRHHAKVHTLVEDIQGGVKVTQISEDPQVMPLIRQHAKRGVSEFVARGWNRVHEPTPLPESSNARASGN